MKSVNAFYSAAPETSENAKKNAGVGQRKVKNIKDIDLLSYFTVYCKNNPEIRNGEFFAVMRLKLPSRRHGVPCFRPEWVRLRFSG